MTLSQTSTSGDLLQDHGIRNAGSVHWNLGAARLIEEAIQRHEGHLATNGALVVRTDPYTGRSPRDRFIVRDKTTESTVDWGDVNLAIAPDKFEGLHQKMLAYLQGADLFIQNCYAGADRRFCLPLRTINEHAWHSLFARQLFVRAAAEELGDHEPEFTLIQAPGFKADPEIDGTRSEAFVVVNFARKLVLIGGTTYAGELKKSVFSIMNFLLPERGVFPMHCSANASASGDVALFFGLSGTGKTTLSADPDRNLIGDDEHGWGEEGVFNFEGGCYAKCIRLSRKNEPQIWDAIRFGAVLENVCFDSQTRELDYDDGSVTENTRAAYPVDFIDKALIPGVGGHPSNVFFLTADAFGVLPPISRLSPEQAMYHFLSGYTAKVAGTERGLSAEPSATFSACFGAPFLPRTPSSYAEMLGDRLRRHKANCWLVNTGWAGGAYGVGKRMALAHTRAMLRAALTGKLDAAEFTPHPVFGVGVPKSCPDVPAEFLDARGMWTDKQAYDEGARTLAGRFHENFKKFANAGKEIREAGPRADS